LSTTNQVLNVSIDGGLGSILQVQIVHLIGDHLKLAFSPSVYEARITCTFKGKPISIFDIPVETLLVLITKYHKHTNSKPSTKLLTQFKSKKKNIKARLNDMLRLYLREKAHSSFLSSIDVITIDKLSDRPVGRTKIELDADIINFVAVRDTGRNFGSLFLLHQTNLALVIQIFRNKDKDLRNWFDMAVRITKYFSVATGFIGPIILRLYSNSSNIYEDLSPIFYIFSYIGVFALWYKFAPRLILRFLIRIVIKKIME
jgi:hypothetical protein